MIEKLMPFWQWAYENYFRVTSDGWEHIPDADTSSLIVGSHNGGLAAPDMVMAMYDWFRHFGAERPVYGLMHDYMWTYYAPVAKVAVQAGGLRAHPKMATAALKSGASVLVYPGGAQDVFRPYSQRDRIEFAGRTGFIKLALRTEVPIVPIISWGAHEGLVVLTEIHEPVKKLLQHNNLPWLFNIDPVVLPIYLGLPWGLAIGPLPNLPLPLPIHIRVCPPIHFERQGREAAKDREYVAECCERVRREMQRSLDQLVQEKSQ
ncbi:MAG: glycerol acyltransferase [Cyanobacteria bacterium P01_H01_bin.130]